MIVKYKVSDFAKDLNLSAKKVLDELAAMGSTGKKNSSNLEENELNYLLEKFSKDNSVANLDEFLNSAKAPKEEPKAEKKAEQKAEKKAEKKPEAPKADKKPQQPAAKAEQPKANNNNNNNNGKHGDKKPEQHKKREEKTVSFSELARETGAKATAAGLYTEADAHTLEEILAAKEQGSAALEALMLPVESVFTPLPLLMVEPWVEQHLYNGCPTSRYPAADGRYRVRSAAGQFLGLANITGGVLRVEKLFVERN